MGLGWDALTAASHMALIAACVMLFFNVGRLRFDHDIFARVVGAASVRLSFFGVLTALITERLYYVTARVLHGTEIDLWEAHPAPEMLSMLVAASIASLSTSLSVASSASKITGTTIDVVLIFAVWLIVAVVLI